MERDVAFRHSERERLLFLFVGEKSEWDFGTVFNETETCQIEI